MRQLADARGRPVALPDRVARVVSLVPSLTEWLVLAGVGERLVGVTDWCVEPAAAVARLPKVRGTKNPDLRAIRALEPDLVVANAEENRKLDVQRLEADGLAVFVTMPTTVAGAVAELRGLAKAVGELPAAAGIDAELVAALAAAWRGRPAARVRYACAVWRDPWMWVGRRTYAADLLALAGAEPVLDDPATRYPRLDPEAIAALRPEVVLLPSEPYAFGQTDAEEVAAWSGARAELVDGRALTWYGPRIPAALAGFRALLAAAGPPRARG
ncbi:MAG TPA: helical backbone metal receptor [Actinomycetota bacterium]|nr:helical backbone metal receptor [Actinomycetota bacterium]